MKYEALYKEIQMLFEMMNIETRDVSVVRDDDLDMLTCSISLKHVDAEIFFEENEQAFRDMATISRSLLEKKHGLKTNILFDINGKQMDFINQAKEKAKIAAERVNFFGKEYEFGYVNAYERMIIHSYLKNQAGIETISRGEGHERRLIVKKQEK